MITKTYKKPMSVQLLKLMRFVSVQVPTADGGVEKIRVDIRKELSLSRDSLDEILSSHPQQAFFWNHARQAAISMVRKAEEDYESTIRRYYLSYRHKRTEERASFTDKSLESESFTNDVVTKSRSKLNALRDQLGILTSICDALEHRRSALIQMGGAKRAKSF
jgi:hypothetical protein